MSVSPKAAFNIDDLNLAVTEEWYPVPLDAEQSMPRWAKNLAATLATGDEATLLAQHLDDVRSRLMMLKDANMSAAVYLPHASLGVIDCLLTYTAANTSPQASATAFLRQAEEQEGKRSPGSYIHDVKTWRDTVTAGKLAGARTVNSYQEPGAKPWTEERVVINVYPPKARQFVQLTFTASAGDSFNDLPLFATNTAKNLTVELSPADGERSKQAHTIASAHPVDNSFRRTLGLGKALNIAGIGFIIAAFAAVVTTLALITIADAPTGDPYATEFAPLYLIAGPGGDAEKWITATPTVLLLLAMCCLIPAELLRRGAWSERATTFLKGGSNIVTFTALPVRTHIGLLTTAFAAWLLLIPVPVLLYVNQLWPATLNYTPRNDALFILGLNGSVAALLCGMSAASLLKKFTYDERAASGADSIVAGSRSVTFWRWFSYRWRLELAVGGLAAVFIGLVPVFGVSSPLVVAIISGVLGVGLAGLAVHLCLNAWRSGESLRQGESVA